MYRLTIKGIFLSRNLLLPALLLSERSAYAYKQSGMYLEWMIRDKETIPNNLDYCGITYFSDPSWIDFKEASKQYRLYGNCNLSISLPTSGYQG